MRGSCSRRSSRTSSSMSKCGPKRRCTSSGSRENGGPCICAWGYSRATSSPRAPGGRRRASCATSRGRGELRGRERGELRGREGEEIALDEGEVGCLVDRAVGKGAAAGGDAALGEELLDREGGDLDADDGMASLAQPLKVQALAAQGHEDGRVR